MYCSNCGTKVGIGYKYCENCGTALYKESAEEASSTSEREPITFQDTVRGTFMHATQKVNQMVGEEGNLELNLKDVFSDVFKKHTKEDAEKLFISGTSSTTPAEKDISTSWPKPWLFGRIFIVLAVTFVLLYIATDVFENLFAVPGMIIMGSFAAPVSLLILFWKMNAPRNISFYEIGKMFFVGGTASIVATLVLYEVFPVYDLDFSSAIIVGAVEEVGKLAIILYFIKKMNPKYILNGLLVGAAIGAGFAAFESAGYAYTIEAFFGESEMMNVIFLRGWMSIGTHVAWSAIAGAAVVYAKGAHPLKNEHIFNSDFLKLFSVSIILHAVWDMPLEGLQNFYFVFIVLIIVAWIFIFSLINAGLKQIVRLNKVYEESNYEE